MATYSAAMHDVFAMSLVTNCIHTFAVATTTQALQSAKYGVVVGRAWETL